MKKIRKVCLGVFFLLLFIQGLFAENCTVKDVATFKSSGGIYYATFKDSKLWLYEPGYSSNSFKIEMVDLNNPMSPMLLSTLNFQYKDAYSYSAGDHLFDFLGSDYIIAVGTNPANLINIASNSSAYVNLKSNNVESEVFSYGNYVYMNGNSDDSIDIYQLTANTLSFLSSFKACNSDKEVAKISYAGNGYLGLSCNDYNESKSFHKVFKLASSLPTFTNFEILDTSSNSKIVYIDSTNVYLWSTDKNDYLKGTLKIYNLSQRNLVNSIPMNSCSRQPAIYGDYAICVKDEMGFMIYDMKSNSKIAEWEDKDSNIWGVVPFSKDNELYIALWAIWLDKNQNSGFKIFKIDNCQSSTSQQTEENNELPTNCSVYDYNSQSFSLNCINIGNEFYSVSMKLIEATKSQITFQIYNYAKLNSGSSENCSNFNFFTNTLFVPCIKVGEQLFNLELYLSTPDGKLDLKGANYYSN